MTVYNQRRQFLHGYLWLYVRHERMHKAARRPQQYRYGNDQ